MARSAEGSLSDLGRQAGATEVTGTDRARARDGAARRSTCRALSKADLSRAEAGVSRPEAGERDIMRLCAEHGLKITGRRSTIARVLSEASDHPDVEEIYRRAAALDGRISIATVYRTVRLFEEKGILQRRDFGSGRARYEPTEHGPHYHLIDVDTGKVVEFRNSEHERLVRALAERLGFEVVSLRLEVFGKRLEARPAQEQAAAGDRANGEARSPACPSS